MPSPLRAISLQEARDHIERRCFTGPADHSIGIELELFPVGTTGWPGPVEVNAIERALAGGAPLPGGSTVTFEPGGQLELSSRPCRGVDEACTALAADVAAARSAVGTEGLALVASGSDPVRRPARLRDTPRYRAMEAYFDADGDEGRTMMCSTASVQVNLSLGPPDQLDARWRLAHDIGPTLVAAFANSPWLCGRATGWRSSRLATWFAIDPTRTAPPALDGRHPVAHYASYALDARVMLVRGGGDFVPLTEPQSLAAWVTAGHDLGWPTIDDVDYHLTTLFPPVRPKGWLEVRYLDAVPDPWWGVAAGVVTALLDDDTAAETARRAVAGTEGRWLDAARWGLKDEALAASAVTCFTAAVEALERMHPASTLADDAAAYLDAYVAQGRCPADEMSWTLKADIASQLAEARDRSLGLVQPLDDDDLLRQHSPLMSPLAWDLAHVGNYEDQWLLGAVSGERARADLDDLYDAFRHPRRDRPALPMLAPDRARLYIAGVRERALDVLDKVDLDGGAELLARGFVYGMVVQHEHQHDETMLATLQLRSGAYPLPTVAPAPGDDAPVPAEVLVAGGPFVMGTDLDPWAYDNERPSHEVDLAPFWIDTTPVTNRAYLEFMADGGYDRPDLWTAAGWAWRTDAAVDAPQFWHRSGPGHSTWTRNRFGLVEDLPVDQPVQHVCWYEADAYARWAGRRLPTEAEWEKAASWSPDGTKRRFPWGDASPTSNHANLWCPQARFAPTPAGSFPDGAGPWGARQLVGDVWEWTASDFAPYPGFRAFPYAEYSEVFLGAEYKVLRGGSWATHAAAVRTTFRNWDYPIRRQIFSGFRCARDA